jgi:hypothetical protein
MVLPSGVNKATGLRAALRQFDLSTHNTVGIGDAENDHAFLDMCECSAAVADALPALRAHADLTMSGGAGVGVAELCELLLANDLRDAGLRPDHRAVTIGFGDDGREAAVPIFGRNLLLAGAGGDGKSLAHAILESLAGRRYQICVVDPEGNFPCMGPCLVLGDRSQFSPVQEVVQVLKRPKQGVVVNVASVPPPERDEHVRRLMSELLRLRADFGRPHWIVLDQAQNMFSGSKAALPTPDWGLLLISEQPERVSPEVLAGVDSFIVAGDKAPEALRRLAEKASLPAPLPISRAPRSDEALLWRRSGWLAPMLFRPVPAELRRRPQ